MHVSNDSRINLLDEAATLRFAARLAAAIFPGLVIYLHGDLGAGKTTLVRGLLQAAGYAGRVKSPTYTLLEPYEINGLKIRHFDLYRFRDDEEWEASGFRDEFGNDTICFVEWPQKAGKRIPAADLELSLDMLPQGRELHLRANTPAGQQCLSDLRA